MERHLHGEQGIVVGFLGAWHVVDEAHVVGVGVGREYQGKGVGELLLIGAIHQASANGMSTVTLEVRPSNVAAVNLYSKYGFKECGVRKGYYTDDREDAIIMSAEFVGSRSYLECFGRLREQHRCRWGDAELDIA